MSLWSVVFVVCFVAIVGGTAGFVEWYVRATYFVGFDGNRVTVFEGRPGGFLWFHPHVARRTSLTRAKVFPPYVPLLEKGMIETSYAAARKVAANLGHANAFLALPTSDTTPVAVPAVTLPVVLPPTSTSSTTTTTSPRRAGSAPGRAGRRSGSGTRGAPSTPTTVVTGTSPATTGASGTTGPSGASGSGTGAPVTSTTVAPPTTTTSPTPAVPPPAGASGASGTVPGTATAAGSTATTTTLAVVPPAGVTGTVKLGAAGTGGG